jgi:hypothetical protein
LGQQRRQHSGALLGAGLSGGTWLCAARGRRCRGLGTGRPRCPSGWVRPAPHCCRSL